MQFEKGGGKCRRICLLSCDWKKKTVTWSEIDMVKTAPAKYGKDITIYDRENHRICKLEASMKNQADFIETMRMHYVPIW